MSTTPAKEHDTKPPQASHSHHTKAAEHHLVAAAHHKHAALEYEAGNHHAAAHHAIIAEAHAHHATEQSTSATRKYANLHGPERPSDK